MTDSTTRERGDGYSDLADAVWRGELAGTIELEEPELRGTYVVERDTWVNMAGELLASVLVDAGSVQRAARELDLPEAWLAGWVEAVWVGRREVVRPYVVWLGPWRRMVDGLLAEIAADAGSARKAAKLIGMPRSTLCARIRAAARVGAAKRGEDGVSSGRAEPPAA